MLNRVYFVAAAAITLAVGCSAEVAAPTVAVAAPGPVVVAGPLPNGTLIKGEDIGNNHKYWIMLNGTKHASELKTVTALGLNPAAARILPPGEVAAIPDGIPMHTDFAIVKLIPQDMTKIQNRTLIKSSDSPTVYIIAAGQRHSISDPAILNALAGGAGGGGVVMISPDQMAQIPEGPHW